jgi:hypothetical protein
VSATCSNDFEYAWALVWLLANGLTIVSAAISAGDNRKTEWDCEANKWPDNIFNNDGLVARSARV